jgi:hypothetical protein
MDWLLFLEDNQIEFVTRGPNTKRGEVSIQCPWCGDDDPSQHLGISLTSDNWGCLRNRNHSGHRPFRLVAALLDCSKSQSKLIVGQYSSSDPESLEEAIALLDLTSEAPSPAEEPEKAPPTRPIFGEYPGPTFPVSRRFWNYLKGRGYNNVQKLVRTYDLSCCTVGKFKDRIIIPVHRGNDLVAWTGRAIINPKNAPRYLSSKNIKATVFNEEKLRRYNGKVLFICEGPFDAMKVDYYGNHYGARATCTFGTNVTIPQIMILNTLMKNFEHTRVLFDKDAQPQAMQLADWLPGSRTSVLAAQGDPGDLTHAQVTYLATNYNNGRI